MADTPHDASRKLSRQQLRAQAREKKDATGWIAALRIGDPGLQATIQRALGARHVTRSELEDAIGMSLAGYAAQEATSVSANAPSQEPERITLQHILISFAGAGTRANRPREEAERLARETLDRAAKGEDFDGLVRELTDDSHPGIYRLSNHGVSPQAADEYRRGNMVPAFGDVGFSLAVGEIGMSEFDQRTSPYGWHIIKRLA